MSDLIDRVRSAVIPESLHTRAGQRGIGIAIVALGVGIAVVPFGYSAGGVVICAVALGACAGAWLTSKSVDSTLVRPLEEIASRVEVIAARDVVALADAIANIGQGERPRPLVVQAAVVAVPTVPVLRRIAQAVNTTVLRLEGSAEQFNASAIEPCRRLFYVGPDDYLAGSACAEEMGSRLEQGGDVLVLTAKFRHAGLELRRRGFESTLQERFPRLSVSAAFENDYDPQLTHQLVRDYLKTRPMLAGIYSTEAVGVRGAVEALVDAGLGGAVVVLCHDVTDKTAEYLTSGLMAGALTQDPYGQGHDTPTLLFNHVVAGWMPPESRLATRMDFVTSANSGRFSSSSHGEGEPAGPAGARAKPMATSPRPIRIAVLGVADNPFWTTVRDGAVAAEEELKPYNGMVEWIVPERDGIFDAGLRGREIERLIEARYDAIASPIFDVALVPFLNRAVDAGIAVATYNSEASSLQGLVATLSRQRRRLEMTATQLEISATLDPLTEARNRRLMDQELVQLKQAVTESRQPAAIVMLDIDHFKAYNDAFGHGAGDLVLKQVAQSIQREIRPQDRLYRYGGDEFLVILRMPTLAAAMVAGGRITAAIEALRIAHEDNKPWGVVTTSAGIAIVGDDERPVAASVGEADAALYTAKKSGRNRVSAARSGHGPGSATASPVGGWKRTLAKSGRPRRSREGNRHRPIARGRA